MPVSAPPPHAGLCASCRHLRLVTNDRGSVFVRCAHAALDPSYPKYPRLPVISCAAHQHDDGAAALSRPLQKGIY
jgi:hypothetical protein